MIRNVSILFLIMEFRTNTFNFLPSFTVAPISQISLLIPSFSTNFGTNSFAFEGIVTFGLFGVGDGGFLGLVGGCLFSSSILFREVLLGIALVHSHATGGSVFGVQL